MQIESYHQNLCITHVITNTPTLSMAALIRESRGTEGDSSAKSTLDRAI